MIEERDKFLTEAMGKCWHNSRGIEVVHYQTIPDGHYPVCSKCGTQNAAFNPKFNMWSGFGLLWEWVTKQEWYDEFLHDHGCFLKGYRADCLDTEIIHPDRFADALYAFLKEKKCPGN